MNFDERKDRIAVKVKKWLLLRFFSSIFIGSKGGY